MFQHEMELEILSNLDCFDLEVWGGAECSVTRIGSLFRDQLELSGHAARLSDLDLAASLGIKKIRAPILWERVYGYSMRTPDWLWSDLYLGRIRDLGIEPIAGLLHHGSGPAWTSLLDPEFPLKFAEYAYQVASRYPWISFYTPVNEPLTTARFSALYGHWYPHRKSDSDFILALLNQCRGIIMAMEAIRSVNQDAQLVQTEDLSITLSTSELDYQAQFDNQRRWLSLDLLTGKFSEKHPLFSFLSGTGVQDDLLESFVRHNFAPSIMGFNYYVTSPRFLDHRCYHYPKHLCGGNGFHKYADVEAVRVGFDSILLLRLLLKEAWDRYQIPLALTETHLTCESDQQVRWLLECWSIAQHLRSNGKADIKAVTSWALFGLYDWDTLTVSENFRYESGVFNPCSPEDADGPLAKVIRSLAEGNFKSHGIKSALGWWSRPDRIHYRRAEPHLISRVIAA